MFSPVFGKTTNVNIAAAAAGIQNLRIFLALFAFWMVLFNLSFISSGTEMF